MRVERVGPWILWCLPLSAWGLPEGSPQLGATQGLEAVTRMAVTVVAPGETIRLCSSDDGVEEPAVGEIPIDAHPGALNPVDAARRGQEVLIQRPDALVCGGDAPCPDAQVCVTREGLPVVEGEGKCALAFAVTRARGWCNARDRGAPLEIVADVAGDWLIDLAGEPETLSRSGTTTRYFEVEVLGADGAPVPDGGRLHSTQWLLNAHNFDIATDADFYVEAKVEGGARVFIIDLQGLRGFRYSILANTQGLREHPNRSWCQYGEPAAAGCPFFGDATLQPMSVHYRLFLNFPSPAPAPAPSPTLSAVVFNDEAGTASLSPDGDGTQDAGLFSFESNLRGVYKITLDTDGDGRFDASSDLQLSGRAVPGLNEVPWDGAGPEGAPLPDGDYAWQVELVSAETHFPMSDIEDNVAGFVIFEQAGPAAPRAPVRMYWDDTTVRGPEALVSEADAVEVLPEGSRVPAAEGDHQRRAWRQPARAPEGEARAQDVPLVFDTWVVGAVARVTELGCRRCPAPVDHVHIGRPDESGDADGDGLSDDQEDLNGNGVVDPGETDPNQWDTDGDSLSDRLELEGDNPTDPTRADTDGDGLPDGVEDANQDGALSPGETDPTDPDTDGDTRVDGAEDANGNGVVDPGETDPRVPDFALADAGPGSAAGSDSGLGGDLQMDAGRDVSNEAPPPEESGLTDEGGCGCDLSGGPPAAPWLLLLGALALARRRR